MADETPTPPAEPSPTTHTPTLSPSERRAATARKWRRRLVRVIVVVIVLVMAGRALVHLIFPPVLARVAAIYGLNAQYDKLDLYMFGGDIGLWGLRITPVKSDPADSDKPILSAGYVRGSVSLWALLRGHLHVERAEAEDADLVLERTADGKLPLLERFISGNKTSTAATQPASNGMFSLDPPLAINTLRLQNARAHVRDQAIQPATDLTLALDLLVSDVGSSTHKTHVEMQLTSPEALGVLNVRADGQSRDGNLEAEFTAKMYGLNLLPAKPYLAPLGLVPTEKDLQGTASGDLTATVTQATTATATQPATAGVLSASLNLYDLLLTADSDPAVSVKSIKVDAPSLVSHTIHVANIDVRGARLAASRAHDGRLRFAGIELVSAPPSAPATQPAAVPAVAQTAAPVTSLPAIDLDRLFVGDTRIEFVDSAFDVPNRLALNVPRFELQHMTTDPAKASQTASFVLRADAPGIAKMIDVSGFATPAALEKSIELDVYVGGIHPTAAAPYLSPMGIMPTLEDAVFKCHLLTRGNVTPSGVVTASLKVDDIALVDRHNTLLAMPSVAIDNASLDPATSRIHVGDIAIDGPTLAISNDAKGLASLGFIYHAPKTVASSTVSSDSRTSAASLATSRPTPTTVAPPMIALPTLALDHLTWHQADFTFTDRSSEQPLELGLKDLAVDANNLVFDSSATEATPGTIKASFSAPGVVEHAAIEGHIAPKQNAIAFDVTGQSDGITAERLKPLLRKMQIDPTYKNGTIQFAATGSARQQNGALIASLGLRNVALSDGDQHWLSLGKMQIDEATFDGNTAVVRSIAVDSPSLQATRDSEGRLTVAGIKLLPAPAQAIVAAPTTAPAPTPTRIDLSLPVVVRLNALRVANATIGMHDEAVLPATDLSATASVTADALVAGVDAPPSPFALTLSSPGVIDSLKVDGHLLASPAHQAIDLIATGTGVSGQTLEPYLPPNVAITLHNAAFAAKLAASIQPNPAGGSSATLSLTDTSLADGASPDPLGGFGALRVNVDRIDLPANVVAVKEVAVEHANLSVRQEDRGVSVLGVNLAPKTLRAAKPAPPVTEAVATTQTSSIAALTALAREKPPLISLDHLSLEADRLSLSLASLTGPIVVTDASLKNTSPIRLLGDRPTERKPFDLSARARVVDLIDSIAVDANLAPFAGEPHAKVVTTVDGIHGDQLVALVPKAGDLLSADDLNDGHFTVTTDAQLGFSRRGLFGIDMTRDITGRFDVTKLALTNASEPKPLAGVDAVHGEGLRYSPTSGSVVLKVLEISKPAAHIVRDDAGIHAFGVTLKTPKPATQPATQEVVTAPTPRAIEVTPSSAPAPAAGAEARIDRLTISGVDLTIEDRVGKPTTILPITQLDVDVKGLSTAAFTQPNKPIRFNAIVGAGKVDLPPRKETKDNKLVPREIFSEASASGNVTLVPKPNGYVKASLSGLEMTAIRGLASEFGITLGGGTFDARIDVRMNGGDSFTAKVFPTFNELRLKEVANGPVQSILQLPAPPDVVISTLEDADGSITFPVNVPINAGKLDTGAVVGSAVGAVGKVVAEAMIAAPLKAAKLVAMLGGADVSSDRTKGLEPVSIEYAAGESQLSSSQLDALGPVLALMKDDPTVQVTLQHTLGSGDVRLAEQRANPLTEDTRGLAENLRRRKYDLQRQQSNATVQLQVAMATGTPTSQTAAAVKLRAVSTQLKENGDDLDQVLDLLSPGASRQADRRTRSGAILLGDLRLRAVRDSLLQSDVPGIATRIRQANALYNPAEDDKPGTVTLVLTREAKS